MPDNQMEIRQNQGKVLFALVAWRYSDERSVMLVGEAEIVIETSGSARGEADRGTNLYAIRVDILSAFDPEGRDCYAMLQADPLLCKVIEAAALEHYLFPPQVAVGLPKRIVEW